MSQDPQADDQVGRPPAWFWIVSVLALLWNVLGGMAFLAQVLGGEAAIEAMPENQQEWARSIPAWINVVFGIAVASGLLACVLLLRRRRLAFPISLLSAVFVVVQMTYTLLISGGISVLAPADLVLPGMVVVLAILLVWFAQASASRDWLR